MSGHDSLLTGSYWILFVISGGAYLTAFAIMHALIPDMKPMKIEERSKS